MGNPKWSSPLGKFKNLTRLVPGMRPEPTFLALSLWQSFWMCSSTCISNGVQQSLTCKLWLWQLQIYIHTPITVGYFNQISCIMKSEDKSSLCPQFIIETKKSTILLEFKIWHWRGATLQIVHARELILDLTIAISMWTINDVICLYKNLPNILCTGAWCPGMF